MSGKFTEGNEGNGTEAAAATGMMMVPLSAKIEPPKPFRKLVDRPFLFLIEDEKTGVILFCGVIFDPST